MVSAVVTTSTYYRIVLLEYGTRYYYRLQQSKYYCKEGGNHIYVTSQSGICPILELDGWGPHPNQEFPVWDGVSTHPKLESIPKWNLFLKIRRSRA